ncbi:hypothetical protein EW026_g4505 [Hermanssonia centrifuga]|uniref:DNA repair protein REV1 n=1 Tax=Hermanssonia centrifuga TaxID=98765 RepID=A0A4S4KLG0_9APHY|nr:hypothetical protein EW026_g4505 [Hermanssonia centrifuga]
MPPCTQPGLKRRWVEDDRNEQSPHHKVLALVDENPTSSSYMSSNTYGASRFGEFGEYMSRKRAKLQIQNAEMDGDDGAVESSRIFRGLQIYINGFTKPSVQDLRQLIVQHGEQAERVHGYAASGPNAAAERAMADPAWRAAHTSVAPDFVEGYYRNSRLHHLSAWKAELRNLVAEAQERAENSAGPGEILENETDESVGKILCENMHGKDWVGDGARDVSMKGAQLVRKGKGKAKQKAEDEDKDRVIMHCDFDSFFVSAGLVDRPHLRGKPVVVCHSQGSQGGQSSTSEIASASYEARKYGVKGGMSLQQARNLCPGVITIPYEFNRYKQFSLQFYTILMAHADDLQAVSVDEALIDVTSSIRRILLEIAQSRDPSSSPVDPAKGFAEAIRAQVKKATGCEDLPEFIATLNIDDLHGFGYAALQKAEEKLGTTNLGELAKKSKAVLCDALGKGTGETLYNAIRGVDGRKLESDKPRKSVSCDINYGIRFENNEQAEAFIYQLAEEVARRLDNIDMRGRSLTLKIMTRDPNAPVEAPKFMGHGICETFAKQVQLVAPGGRATSDDKIIGEHAWRLLKGFKFDPKELRGIVITVQPPSQDADIVEIVRPSKENGPLVSVDLPSFSQVDMSVFEALPKDVRQELEMEYKRRSITPALAPGPILNRSPSMPVAHKAKITIKGTNVRRITRQLAPKSRAGLSSTKSKLFTKPDKAFAVKVSQAELRKLDIDPSVFAALPVELQREQLAFARQAKAPGGSGLVFGGNRIVIKPRNRFRRNRPLFRQPPPKARYRDIPSLKRQGRSKGEKLYFTDKDDIQEVIEPWVNGFTEYPPNQKDVDFFAKYLVHCVDHSRSGDSSLEQAIAVAKWWLVLLRRNFGLWEHVSADDLGIVEKREGQYTSEFVGRVWWNAFREVKKKMDEVARKRFGGSLSLR